MIFAEIHRGLVAGSWLDTPQTGLIGVIDLSEGINFNARIHGTD